MKSVPKIIFYLIFIGIVFNAIKTYYYQNNLEYTLFELVFGWYFKLAFYGNIFISIASVLSFILYRKYFPSYITFCYLGLIILVTIASLSDMKEILKTPSFLYGIKGVGTFVNIGILFFAANTLYFPKLLKLFYYLCFAIIIAGIINLGKVGFGADRQQNLYAIRDFAVYLIWVFPYFLLQDEPNKKISTLNLLTFFVIFVFVLCTGSRSYMLLYAMFFLIKFKDQLKGKNVVLAVAGLGIVMVVGVIILLNSSLAKTVENAFSILSQRSADDSRSDQIGEFIDQIDYNYLFQGVGPKKTWYWSSVGEYAFLDNQFLLLGWWAGLPTLLVYIYFLVRSFFHKSQILIYENIKGTQLIIGLWILACLGLAIYVSFSTDLYYYFITLLMGLHTCNFTKIYNEDIGEA